MRGCSTIEAVPAPTLKLPGQLHRNRHFDQLSRRTTCRTLINEARSARRPKRRNERGNF
jgi:hypothetical protein